MVVSNTKGRNLCGNIALVILKTSIYEPVREQLRKFNLHVGSLKNDKEFNNDNQKVTGYTIFYFLLTKKN